MKVQSSSLESLAASLEGLHSTSVSTFRGLGQSTNQMLLNWSGEAQRSFSSSYSAWSAEMNEINDILRAAAKLVSDAIERYDQAERLNADRWSL